jgi:formate hydrogenlyase subunit 6/NADH:ubiquinone oxidoreductase subunit I
LCGRAEESFSTSADVSSAEPALCAALPGAIRVNRAERELVFEPFRCIVCGACVDGCRRGSAQMIAQYHSPAYTKPEEYYRAPVEVKDEDQL